MLLQACSQSNATEAPKYEVDQDPQVIVVADASDDPAYQEALNNSVINTPNSNVVMDDGGNIIQVAEDTVTPEVNTIIDSGETGGTVSELTASELQAEIQVLEAKLAEMEASGASSREKYMVRKELIVLEEAEVMQATVRADEATVRADEATVRADRACDVAKAL